MRPIIMQAENNAERSSELLFVHIQDEAAVGMRERGLTINPMIPTSSNDGQEAEGKSGATDGSMRNNDDAQQQQILEQLSYYRVLFAEGALDCCGGGDFPRPPGTTTGAMVAAQAYYVLMRASMAANLVLLVYLLVTLNFEALIVHWVILPSILPALACLAATFVLPSKFKAVADEIVGAAATTTRPAVTEAAEVAVGTSPKDDDNDDDNDNDNDESRRACRRRLDLEDINWAGRRASVFSAVWLVAGVGVSIGFAIGHTEKFGLAEGCGAFFSFMLQTCATLPTLGAIFFVLALDVARIKKEIATLAEGARDMSLTLEGYQRSQDYIDSVSGGTKRSLVVVAAIALYNAAGFVANIYYSSKGRIWGDDDEAGEVEHDFFAFALLGHDACLFFAFVYLAVVVNDAADDVCTEVYRWRPNGDEETGGSDAEIRRLSIIVEATTFVGPKEREHRGDSWWRLAAPHAGGISFKVLGVRWTSAYFAALLLSSGASVLSGLYHYH